MIKQFTRFQVAALKRTMKNIAPLARRRKTLEQRAKAILKEIQEVDEQMDAYKQTIEPITGGIDPEVIIASNGTVDIPEKPEIPEDNEVEMVPEQAPVEMEAPGFELPMEQ